MSLLKKNQNLSDDNQAKKKIKETFSFTKIAIIFVLINSELQIWGSYILALLGREAIAEALSQQIVITIIGTMVAYFVKALIENLSKYTSIFQKKLSKDKKIDDNNQFDMGKEIEEIPDFPVMNGDSTEETKNLYN